MSGVHSPVIVTYTSGNAAHHTPGPCHIGVTADCTAEIIGEATIRHVRQATGQPVSTYLGTDGIQLRNDLAGLNPSTVPKILIECANMRNATDAIKVTDPAWREAAAHGIASSVAAFVLQ